MKSSRPGSNISTVEVTNISKNGFWILLHEKEYFLSYSTFPWFKKATIENICDVKLLNEHHLYWKNLDVDLEIASITNPENYPLFYR